jgi:large subunit ribosomal protein L18
MLSRRHRRLRNKVIGDADRPRLCVYRSLKHTYAQVIDDIEGRTLVSASTVEPEVRKGLKSTGDCAAAAKVGEVVAERAQKAGFKAVRFDRGGRRYHGRVKALAEAARKAGLEF